MRYMMIVRSATDCEAGILPPKELIAAMDKFNQEMTRAGVMLSGEGLQPTSKGSRVTFKDGKSSVKDGPFAEVKELIGGFWMIEVKSKEEAIAWARRVPFQNGEIEIRKVSEASDFV